MSSRTLHILTPFASLTPLKLIDEYKIATGDLVADLRKFPPFVYKINGNGIYFDITSKLLRTTDHWPAIVKWLTRFTKETRLQDILSISGFGIWWSLNSLKFQPSVSELGNFFVWIDLLDEIHSQDRIFSVNVFGAHEAIIHIARQVFKTNEIKLVTGGNSNVVEDTSASVRKWLRFVRILLGVIYLIYACIRKPSICFFSSTNLMGRGIIGNKEKLYDIYLGDVARALKSRGWKTACIEHQGTNATWRGLWARRFFFPTDFLVMLSQRPIHWFEMNRRTRRKWRKKWFDLKQSLPPVLEYQGYNVTALILPLLFKEFTQSAPFIDRMTETWRRIFKHWKPKLLYINNSYGRSAIPAIIAAKSLGILTIEQQHGAIGKYHTAYLVPEDVKLNSRVPLCDRMVLWGEHAKRLLLNSGVYSPSQVVVCGFPRIDSLQKWIVSRSETLAMLNVPAQAQVVLYTSTVVVKDAYPTILDSVQKTANSSLFWIIKLHPREKTREHWENAIKKRRLQMIRVVENEVNFYQLLAACDLHISSVSTTMIEAAVFGKPNIGLDIACIPDPFRYKEAGAFLPVAPQYIGETAHAVLNDPSEKEKLLRDQREFANDWCRHDGRAVEVIVDFIENKIKIQ
jgi:hypothetical protein